MCAIYTSKYRFSQGLSMKNASQKSKMFLMITYEHQKSSYKRYFALISQIKGHPSHIKPRNTSEDNRPSFLYCMWGPSWIETIHSLTLLSFILVGKGASFHTQSHKALWTLFKYVTLKEAVLGFIICLQERTTASQPQKVNCFMQTEAAPPKWHWPCFHPIPKQCCDRATLMFTIYRAHCSLILNQQRDWGGKIQF